ncbi:MAG: MMPL family transporter, partial [Acidimicrobiia bacterium]|nr:MMPL family transporter [Acidimicrobiia bacterium]
ESFLAAELLTDQFGVGVPNMVIVATNTGGSVDDPQALAAGIALIQQLAGEEDVTEATSYWSLGSPPSLKSQDGSRALLFVSLGGDQGEVLERSGELAAFYRGTFQGLDVAVGGSGPLFSEVTQTVENDLVKAETIAFPITFVLLILVFGSVVAALLPLGVGAFAIVGTFLALDVIAGLTEVSIFSLNLTTALGLGLAIDYALFVVSRFREELAGGHDGHEAAVRTVCTAGRTVAFSAGTVMVSLAAMLVFPLAFLRSFAYAGMAVVALAAIGAVVVLPALLAVLGPRVDRLAIRRRPTGAGSRIWHRIAMAVMRRPLPIATAAVALLVAFGLPFLGVNLVQSDDRVLPDSSAARQVGDILRAEFDSFESAAIQVVAPTVSNSETVASYSAALSALDGVARVDSSTGSYVGGKQLIAAGPAHSRFTIGGGTYWSVVPAVEPNSEAAEELVAAVRALDAPGEVLVGGVTADLVDTKDALFSRLPIALGFIGLVTFVVLFLMFGSVLVPAKAVVLNLLSLSATFGALVWIFQDGHLSGVLGFTPTGGLDLTIPILMFAIAFGLSMDYEVFLLSRIKEEHDNGADDIAAVAGGLERTGRIVTAAAVLIAVVFVAFATSQVMFMKMFGIGMTLAVLVDAFIVRSTLVPAFMRLAGRANWWAPRWMRPIYRRFGFSESALPTVTPVEEPL